MLALASGPPFSASQLGLLTGAWVLRAFLTFGLVEAVGNAFHYATLIGLVELLALDFVLATTARFVVGMVVNYVLNYRYTFQSDETHLIATPKFFLIAIIIGVLNGLLVHAGVKVAQFNYLAVQCDDGGSFRSRFPLNSVWTFRAQVEHE